MHQIVCRLGLRWGSLQRSPRPPSWFRGVRPPGKGKEGREGERREGRDGKGREGRVGEGRRGSPGMPKSRVGKPKITPSEGVKRDWGG